MSIPYISTREYYDLSSGKTIKKKKYHFSSTNFQNLEGKKEVTIMIHGLRNNRKGAQQKFLLAKNRLRKLGYRYPVIGFSYDSNTKGAHIKKYVKRSLRVGQKIAKKNGIHLGQFILDMKKRYPSIRIRLMGHSLGSEVIHATILYLSKNNPKNNLIESAYFFGSSVERKNILEKNSISAIRKILGKNITNYYAPTDEVLSESVSHGLLENPIGLAGLNKNLKKYSQKKMSPKNHRFASYALTLMKFP